MKIVIFNFLTLCPPIIPTYKGGIIESGYRMSNVAPFWFYVLFLSQPLGVVCLLIHVFVVTDTVIFIQKKKAGSKDKWLE